MSGRASPVPWNGLGRKVNESSPQMNWTPITKPFFEACKELQLGELMHDSLFGLFEAMSAIEMMDPKVDIGLRQAEGNFQPLDFDTALECGHLPMDPETIKVQDLIGIVDETFAAFVTWLEGYSLAHTVFTNLYLHKPFEVTHPLLKAFSIAILKMVDLVTDFIAKGGVYEEEDFQPMLYGLQLETGVTDSRASGMLREVEDDLQRILRATKPIKDDCDNASLAAEEMKVRERQHEEAGALFSRLRFLRLLYIGLGCLNKLEIQEGHKSLCSAREQIQNMKATLEMGTLPEKGKNFIGFEPYAYQKLLPPSFPRDTKIKGRKSSFEFLDDLLERLILSTTIPSCPQNFHSILEFFMEFNMKPTCVLSRSVAQVLYIPLQHSFSAPGVGLAARMSGGNLTSGGAIVTFKDQLRESCRTFIAPRALTMNKSPPYNVKTVKDAVEDFFCLACRPMSLIIQALGHNRARQRDKIPALLEELGLLQEKSSALDDMLHNSDPSAADGSGGSLLLYTNAQYFTTWVMYHLVRLMVRYILSGFELELFSVYEYSYMYWCLTEVLYPHICNCLQRAESRLTEYDAYLEVQKGKNKKKTKTNKKKSVRQHRREITLYQGCGALCAGYFKLLVGLKKSSKIKIPAFDNEKIRFQHRFAPFSNLPIGPAAMYFQYSEDYANVDSSDTSSLYLAAARDFAKARQYFEFLLCIPTTSGPGGGTVIPQSECNALVTVSKINLVASSVLGKDNSRKVDFDFGNHPTFPTLKVT